MKFMVWAMLKTKQNCNCCRPRKGYIIVTEYDDSNHLTIHKIIRRKENGNIDEKYKLEWDHHNDDIKTDVIFEHVMPPWLMISKDGEDYTEQLHAYIAKGNDIRLHFLNSRFGNGKWTILDTKTFEEINFPSTGIIIK